MAMLALILLIPIFCVGLVMYIMTLYNYAILNSLDVPLLTIGFLIIIVLSFFIIKLISTITSSAWIVYNVAMRAYVAVAQQAVQVTSSFIAIIRLKLEEKKQKKEKENTGGVSSTNEDENTTTSEAIEFQTSNDRSKQIRKDNNLDK